MPDIINELREYGIDPIIHDPMASGEEALREYGIELRPFDALTDLDGVIFAVPHQQSLDQLDRIVSGCPRRRPVHRREVVGSPGGPVRSDLRYWSL